MDSVNTVILLTLNNYTLPSVKCSDSFKNIDWDTVDCLIFHSSSDGDIEIVKQLTNLIGKVDKVIYINKNINPLYYCIFTAMDADIYDTEEYLMDEEVLTFLINNYGDTGMTMKQPSSDLETLAKSIATISTSSIETIQKLVSNEFWMRTLNTSVSNIDNAIVRASKININVLDMLTESSKLITELEEGQSRTSADLEKLQTVIEDMERKVIKPSTPFMFSTYKVPVTVQKVLYVKAYGDCRYLKSFLLSYQHYLKMTKQVSNKILFTMPKLKLLMQKYKDGVVRLAQDSIAMANFDANNIFITFEPKKAVMDAFFTRANAQLFIVVDLMFGDVLIEGHMVTKLNAVGGLSDINMFNLRDDHCISPIVAKSSSVLIPHMPKYREANDATKKQLYFSKCGDGFKKIDNLVFTDGR